MKIALITDQHFGGRNDNKAFSEYFQKFYQEQFFPTIEEYGINTIIDLGDTFDRRKYINFSTLDSCIKYWFDVIRDKGMELHVIVGNHCTFFKNTNKINSPDLLLKEYKNVTVYSGPQEVVFDGLKILFIPWICSENREETLNLIGATNAEIVMGHLEISGFEMYKGSPSHGGDNIKIFDKFDLVMSGHFHHKSSYKNMSYLGAPYEMTWSDWNDPRGFHIFDTDTRELTHIENKFKMFNKIHYSDSDTTIDQILDFDENLLKGRIVKVVVHEKNNPYWFDMFINKIDSIGVLNMQVVEDNFNLDLENDEDIIENVEDTKTILNKYAEQFSNRVNVNKLQTFLSSLHEEALTQE